MNNKFKVVTIFLIAIVPILSFSPVFGDSFPKEAKCANSQDGKPVINNNMLECDLRTSIGGKKLLQKTFGLVQRVNMSSDIRVKVNPQNIKTILGEDKISLPTQLVSADIVMRNIKGNGQVLPTSMKISPVFAKTGSDICELKFVDFKPNVSDFRSTHLPSWILKSVEKTLNNNRRFRDKMLKFANEAVVRAKSRGCM